MVVKNCLQVFRSDQFDPRAVVTGGHFWVDVNDLSISLVFKEQTLTTVSDDLVVRRTVGGGELRLPVVVR